MADRTHLSLLTAILLVAACEAARPRPPGSPPGDASVAADAATDPDASVQADAGTPEGGGEMLPRLAGLWSGPATRTPLGDFSMMNVDFRPVTDQFMFGRVDVDEDNALRFGFSIETHTGGDVLTYRNGGFFLGILRDDRTQLIEQDEAEGRYRFCHVERGCDYIDAVYDFESETRLIFDVFVRGEQHVYWDARRLETRPLPPGFTENLVSQGTGDAPFPPMADLAATVTWSTPLSSDAPVWLILTVEGCSPTGCNASRHVKTVASAGATSAELRLAQTHAGQYQVLAVLDRNGNLEGTLTPDSGDGVSLPNQMVDVAAQGETTVSVPIVVDL